MRNTYILMIVQALLTLLLFFSESYIKYATITLFILLDLILFISLLMEKWSYEELLTFSAIFCSAIFLVFYLFMKSILTTVFGIVLMLLFLVIAMLEFMGKSTINSKDSRRFESLQRPEDPLYYYDIESEPGIKSVPEPVMHVKHERKISREVPHEQKSSEFMKDKLASKAVAYELEREAQQLKNAEKLLNELEVYNAGQELLKETRAMQNVQRKIDSAKKAQAAQELQREAAELMKVQKQVDSVRTVQAAKELNREAAEIMKVQKQISNIKKLQQKQELDREVKTLKNAEQKIKQVQFLNQQEKIVKQAKAIAKAQKEVDGMNKKNKKSISKTSKKSPGKKSKKVSNIRTVRSKDESFYFATDNGNTFHEPGCLSIKKVPKNKLTLYTNRKDAMRKGLQPCRVCIPK